MPRVRRNAAEARQLEEYGPEFLEALARGLRVIQAFGGNERPMTLSDVSKVVKAPRATVRRVLYTLSQLGFVELEDKLFRLTPKILTLATSYLSSNAAAVVMQGAVERVSAATRCSSIGAVLADDDFVIVAKATPEHTLSLNLRIGAQLPALSTAIGRVLLAGCDDKEIEKIIARAKLQKLTRYTELDKKRILAAILKARQEGFALVEDEIIVGYRSLAVPLRRYDGRTVAALQIGVHSQHVSVKTSMKEHLPVLMCEAETLSTQFL